MRRESLARNLAEFGDAAHRLFPHYHISFSPTQFVFEELTCPPGSYSLERWEHLDNHQRRTSSGFFDGTYYRLTAQGNLFSMDFGSLEAFKQAILAEAVKRPPTHMLLGRAALDFREYARYRNLGHNGVIPLSYAFNENQFQCTAFTGETIRGRIHTNDNGLVVRIDYHPSGRYGSRSFLLYYDDAHPRCTWYPSRILDVSDSADGRYDVTAHHRVYGVYEHNQDLLPIPRSAEELFTTGIRQEFQFADELAYEVQGTNLIPRPGLATRPIPDPD